MYNGLCRHIARTEGFPDQLKQTNSATKAVRAAEEAGVADFRTSGRDHRVRSPEGARARTKFRAGSIFRDPESDRGRYEPGRTEGEMAQSNFTSSFTLDVREFSAEIYPRIDAKLYEEANAIRGI